MLERPLEIFAAPLRRRDKYALYWRQEVRWAFLVARPADYLPPGTVGQWLPAPCNGGTSKRAATLEPTMRRRGRLGPRAGNPKRTRPNCHEKRYSRTSVGMAQKGEGEGTQDTLASQRHWLLQVVAATAGATRAHGRVRQPFRLLRRLGLHGAEILDSAHLCSLLYGP